MDAISAKEAMIKPNPMKVQIYDQNMPAKPPSSKPV
jgi:hypothetical protein